MTLPETYEAVRPAIVAFGSRLALAPADAPPLFPRILGTGFLVNKHGLVVTNRHVTQGLEAERHPATNKSASTCVVFVSKTLDNGAAALGTIFVDVAEWWELDNVQITEPWYGESLPDLAFVQLKIKETPFLPLETRGNMIRVGVSVATAGFPLGETPLVLHKKVTQVTPTLRKGIVSGVFPFACPQPHGFSIDVMTQGGESGSPVFLEHAPIVIGMIESGYQGTNIKVALPSTLISQALSLSAASQAATDGYPTLESLIPKRITQHAGFRWDVVDRTAPDC